MINISKLNLYDEEAAINHVKSLAFTRNAATEGETKALNYIRRELDKKNIESNVESFEWSKSLRKMQKLIFLWIFAFILANEILLLYPNLTWLIIPLDGIFFLVLILGVKNIFDYSKKVFIGKRKESRNIIATIRAKDLYPKRPVIFFSAHYDSISHNFPSKITKVLLLSAVFLLLSYILLNLVLSIWSIIVLFTTLQIEVIYLMIRTISLTIGGILLTEIFLTFFMKTSNESVGSVDNASGVAILLELAKLIKNNPLEKIDVIFLWCGAEEMGLWGSKQYVSKHFEEFDRDYDLNKSYNINIDMVGTYIGLVDETGLIKKKKINKNLNDVLKASDKQNLIPSEKSKLSFGSGSDHLVFRAFTQKKEKKGFQVTCFLSKKDTKYIHSRKDTLDLCSNENLNGCIDICYNATKTLDLRVE
ncbi:MAG: M28 family metallopeptidase [Candidatus Hodarchaeota archaeon]